MVARGPFLSLVPDAVYRILVSDWPLQRGDVVAVAMYVSGIALSIYDHHNYSRSRGRRTIQLIN